MPGLAVSVLDMAFMAEGQTAGAALAACLDDAANAESLGYQRYWVVEHHNTDATASSAPAVLAGRIAAHTKTIRVGSGGVMLNNHSPLAVAEQFATLEAFFPGRIDLGVGRAAGTDADTARLLRQGAEVDSTDFADRVGELRALLGGRHPATRVTPSVDSEPPIFILGASPDSAELAGRLGVPYAFAHHLAPKLTRTALQRYRSSFVPGDAADRPHAIVSSIVIGAATAEHAEWLSTSMKHAFVEAHRGRAAKMRHPDRIRGDDYSERERQAVTERFQHDIVGGPEEVRAGLCALVAAGADEIMSITPVVDPDERASCRKVVAAVAAELTH